MENTTFNSFKARNLIICCNMFDINQKEFNFQTTNSVLCESYTIQFSMTNIFKLFIKDCNTSISHTAYVLILAGFIF